jgi:PKD repeat protein
MVQGILAVVMKPILMALFFISASLAGCTSDGETSSSEVEAIFDYDPDKNIRTGADIDFDGGASLPSGTSLTYKWDFDNDGAYDDTGRTVTWSYPDAGEYKVKLTVSDGTNSNSQSRTIKIIDADAVEPSADAGSGAPSSDCEGESVNDGNYYLVYICEMDKSLSSKNLLATTTVNLDGSDSEAGGSDEYISDWEWDFDLERDEDGDGDKMNDADESGKTFEWKEVPPGEHKIALTVTNGAGLSSVDEVVVYVNYVAKWNDFSIGGNNSNNPIDIEFSFPVTQDQDSGNTIRKAIGELVYLKEDADCTNVPGANNCRAKLDLYGFNSTDEEAGNTSALGLDQRQYGDCDSDTDCVWLQFTGSYHFSESQWKDDEWTMTLRNEKVNDLEVESLVIRLLYLT